MKDQFLYVIAASPDGPVKLGISKHPDRRVSQLQTGHAKKLRLFHSQIVPDGEAHLYESLLHRDIGYLRSQGEWFDITVADAIAQINVVLIEHAPSELIP